MTGKQLKRSEVDVKDTWDLTLIFKSDKEFLKELEEVSSLVSDVCEYKGNIVKSRDSLLNFLKFSDDYERRLYKLYYYAHLKHDQDTTDVLYQDYFGRVVNLLTEYEDNSSFVNSEIMSVDYSLIEDFMDDDLKEYEFSLEKLFRFKDHILDEKMEKLIANFSKTGNNSTDIYSALTDSDIKFGNIIVDGLEVELTESNYSNFLHSKDRSVRESAFKTLLGTYGNYKNTITKTFVGNIEYLTTLAKLKNYNSAIEASLFGDNVGIDIYNNFIEVVNGNLDILHKYYDLKKDVLDVSSLHIYDGYVEMVDDFNVDYSFKEAKELVIKSLSVLGDDYVSILNKAFDERWIDVYNNVGKRTGAYSSGFYDTKPYILLNYEGKIKDVSTLAHELGHSLHTYYSCEKQNYCNSSYKIFVAEVASTVNELLLNYYMLENSCDKEEKKFILNSLMELFRGTIYRQIMFAEFEKDCFSKHENKEILTYESLCNDYYNLNKKYFGQNVFIDEEIKYEWERIPHFYYNFYVYKYAVGLSCACYIVDGILNNKEGAVDNYKKFLSAGGSSYPVDILKDAGIDVTKKDFILSAIKMFDNTIDDFKKLIEE